MTQHPQCRDAAARRSGNPSDAVVYGVLTRHETLADATWDSSAAGPSSAKQAESGGLTVEVQDGAYPTTVLGRAQMCRSVLRFDVASPW